MDKLDPFNLFENFSYRCWAEDETRGMEGETEGAESTGEGRGRGKKEKRNIKEEGLRVGGRK